MLTEDVAEDGEHTVGSGNTADEYLLADSAADDR
jgi:hypothetical protein